MNNSTEMVTDPAGDKSQQEPPSSSPPADDASPPAEQGGPQGPEPTRYGDWERKGRCSDF